MREESVTSDITVVGGGMAGVCAAIAAARLGATVTLVQNRPVLGGNASSEVRVWVCGATAHGTRQFARETGIMGELFVENQFRNPNGNPVYWDLVVLDAVRAEANISLFLNTDVRTVDAAGPSDERTITSVTGWTMGSERLITFSSPMFLDCTGDGLIGHLAGAQHRIGREAAAEHGESLAPTVADDALMGSTILFYTKDVGHPIKYVAPSFAKDITSTTIPQNRIIRAGDNGAAYWWVEWGGEVDTVHDNEAVRDELWSVIYGIWDYIKNSGRFDADTMALEWVGAVPGKREYRRFVGDYTLNQRDLFDQTQFHDRVAFGGWSIDLHSREGVYAKEANRHWYTPGVYHIPLRSLYSANVSNLLFAGRDISASHVAFGSTRVMATCAVVGQAAGSAAALAVRKTTTPRTIASDHIDELQRIMLREDASIIGIPYSDPSDLAPSARVTASGSQTTLSATEPSSSWDLTEDAGILVPVDPGLDGIDVLVGARADTALEVSVSDIARGENHEPYNLISSCAREIARGPAQWVRFDVGWRPNAPANAFIIIKANPDVSLSTSTHRLFGTIAFTRRPSDPYPDHPELRRRPEWLVSELHGRMFCFRSTAPTNAFAPTKVVDGYLRPYAGPHLWISEPLVPDRGTWFELEWDHVVSIAEIRLTFNDDVNEHLINLHAYHTPFEVPPTLVADYHIQAATGGSWTTIADIRNNRRRRRVHRLSAPAQADRLRVVVTRTNGARYAEIIAISIYSNPPV